jgi:S-adenosylmethionine uptake transporter
LLGIALTLTACALFALLDSATKFAGQCLSMLLVLWLRFLSQALVTTALVLPRHGLAALHTAHPKFQAARALFGITTSVCAFFCIQSMPLGNFTAIWSACPLLVVVASAWLYQEQVSPLRWLLLAVGLACVIVIVRPERSGQPLGWHALLPVGLLVSGSGYLLLGSRLARLDAPHTTQLYSTWLPLLLTTPLLPWFWQAVPLGPLWWAVAAMGLCSGVGHLILLQAYTHATPSVISPFLYSQIGFAMAVGWLLFGQVPDAQSLLGMAGVVVCGMLSMWMSVRGRK